MSDLILLVIDVPVSQNPRIKTEKEASHRSGIELRTVSENSAVTSASLCASASLLGIWFFPLRDPRGIQKMPPEGFRAHLT